MNLLNRLSIRARLYFGTGFSLLLLTVIGLTGFWALHSTQGTLKTLLEQKVQTLTSLDELRLKAADIRRSEKDIIINFNNSVEVGNLREAWKKQLGSLIGATSTLQSQNAEDAALTESIKQVQAALKEYETGLTPILEQVERAQIDGAAAGAYGNRAAEDTRLVDTAEEDETQLDLLDDEALLGIGE